MRRISQMPSSSARSRGNQFDTLMAQAVPAPPPVPSTLDLAMQRSTPSPVPTAAEAAAQRAAQLAAPPPAPAPVITATPSTGPVTLKPNYGGASSLPPPVQVPATNPTPFRGFHRLISRPHRRRYPPPSQAF